MLISNVIDELLITLWYLCFYLMILTRRNETEIIMMNIHLYFWYGWGCFSFWLDISLDRYSI